jgi:putative ABC transport system permease protein
MSNTRLLVTGSLRVMSRYKLRTFFMSFGVAIGVATLIAGRLLGTGAEQQILERVNRMFGPGTILVFAQQLKYADLEAIQEQLGQVVGVAPRFGVGETDISYQGLDRKAAVYGHTEQGEFVWNRNISEGRFLSSDDLSGLARVAVLGPSIAKALFANQSPVGEEIMIGSVQFRVIGLLEAVGIDPHGEDRDQDVFVPITTAMRRLTNDDDIGTAKIVVENMEQVDEDADQVAEILRERHRIAPGEPDDFAIYTSKFAGRVSMRASKVLNVYVFVAAGVVLLVAAGVISSIMLVVVQERIAEIGLRKAVGATEGQIGFQFLFEAVAVTIVSGLAGIGLGLAAARMISSLIDVPMVITPDSIVLGLVSAITVGIVSGIVPARRAARLDPVDALR